MVCSHGPQIGQFSCPSCRFEAQQRRDADARRRQWAAEQREQAEAQARAEQQAAQRRAAEIEAAARAAAPDTARYAELQARQAETERLLRGGSTRELVPVREQPQAPASTPSPRIPARRDKSSRAADAAKVAIAVGAGLAVVGAAAAFFLARKKQQAGPQAPGGSPVPPKLPVPQPANGVASPRVAPTTAAWRHVGSSGQLGPMSFHPDGGFAYGQMRFDQTSSLARCRFGDASVDKAPGAGEVVSIAAAGVVHRLRFVDGSWYYRAEGV